MPSPAGPAACGTSCSTPFGLAEDDPDIGCVVLRGAGRAFSGGGDITGNERRERLEDDERFLRSAAEFHDRLRASAVPIVASVHGYCLGAGLTLAASCDLIIAGEGARFGFPEGRIGLAGATAVVPVVGRQWAKFLMITGELLNASQARWLGLVLSVERGRRADARTRWISRPGSPACRAKRCCSTAGRSTRRRMPPATHAARAAALAADALTTNRAAHATAPDGRTFRSIIDAEGMDGLEGSSCTRSSRSPGCMTDAERSLAIDPTDREERWSLNGSTT